MLIDNPQCAMPFPLKPMPALILDSFLPYRLVNLAARVSQALARVYETEFGITIPEWRIIANLGQHEFLTPGTLVELTQMDKAKVSRTIARLTAKGYVSKFRDDTDKRAYWLRLSKPGLKLYQQVAPKALAWEAEFVSSLSPGEFRQLLDTVGKLEARLGQMPGD